MQQVKWDGLGVVGVQQLLALLSQLREPAALAGDLGFSLLPHPRQCLAELRPHPLNLACRQPDLAVDALDGGLDQIDRDVGLLAAGSLHPPNAKEVGVLASIALGLDQAHPRSAASAVEGALEVVVV